ncbi:putative Monothiol glutaredoxin-4 [Glarea lozoyensis 74030]|uniref:Putative Monothiol glutaredoxin-4 n=1 Tax=Glarea lozoyensis (strain ATCC 74030 / MF5533) TaxID=1104152 RepID=H0EF23_GLAL7|nr:putative Monothiol glutaredoxin-4 [Glarea lozoyensis 74030]
MRTVLETLASSYPVTEPLSTSWVSMNAEEVMDVSDSFDVTAVPYLVLTRNNQVLETVSGSDATKVRAAIEKHAKSSGGSSNGSTAAANNSGSVAKNLSSYTPTAADPATAPQYSSGEVKEDKEALHERLATLVKAAPVMLFMKGTPSAPQCKRLLCFGRILSTDDDVRQGLKEFSDWPTFPQLYVDGELVGGLDIVKEEMANDPDFFKAYSVPKSTPDSAAAS